jgi:hypothetical protein
MTQGTWRMSPPRRMRISLAANERASLLHRWCTTLRAIRSAGPGLHPQCTFEGECLPQSGSFLPRGFFRARCPLVSDPRRFTNELRSSMGIA